MLRSIPEIADCERSEYNRSEEVILAGCNRSNSCHDSEHCKHCGRKVVFHGYFFFQFLFLGIKNAPFSGAAGVVLECREMLNAIVKQRICN